MIRIATERLVLEPPNRSDVAAMRAITDHADTNRHLGGPQSEAEFFTRFARNAGSWTLYGYGGFMVRLAASGETVGQVGVFHAWRGLGDDVDDMPEAGWILRHDMVGQGLAREAVTAALDWFDTHHGPSPIVALIAPDNAPSLALAARLGFAPVRDTLLADAPVRVLRREPCAKDEGGTGSKS
ncbi:GNAT family N-acetyltransferase [Croceibacterium ferulae]|uniref:GNAT family N-acetyltransferase n=1 Tax=Croceibacterium ferulae TaxID=1854641 RepID=UPI001F4D8332|nr:GNAT family N-acetyltransferase [Croceibacterium ferulae]